MKNNTLRLISGEFRGRKISFPSINGLRPTSDFARETLFNWLQSYIADAVCIDLFAGSGALGLESVSRGAKEVCFCDTNFKAIQTLKKNIQTLSIQNIKVLKQDGFKYLKNLSLDNSLQNIIFLDPPFAKDMWQDLIDIIIANENIKNNTLIYFEADSDISLLFKNKFEIIKSKKRGNVWFYLVRENCFKIK